MVEEEVRQRESGACLWKTSLHVNQRNGAVMCLFTAVVAKEMVRYFTLSKRIHK